MASIKLSVDTRVLSNNASGLAIKISSAANNGISFDGNSLKATKGPNGSSGNTNFNTGGNSIRMQNDGSEYFIGLAGHVGARINGTGHPNIQAILSDILTDYPS